VVFSLLIFIADWKASFYDFVLFSSYFFIFFVAFSSFRETNIYINNKNRRGRRGGFDSKYLLRRECFFGLEAPWRFRPKSLLRMPEINISHTSFFFFVHLFMCFSREANLREHKALGSNFCWNFFCNLLFWWWPLGWLHEACSALNFKVNLLLWAYVELQLNLNWIVLDMGLPFVLTSTKLKW